MYPGKVTNYVYGGICYIAYNGTEIPFKMSDKNCFVLAKNKSNPYRWVSYNANDPLPEKAFVAGRDDMGTSLYSFKAMHKNAYHCGYVRNGQASIPYGWKEISFSSGYVLIQG